MSAANRVDANNDKDRAGGGIDFDPFYQGITVLKFGRSGLPHEKVFTLTRDNRFIIWKAELMCWKFGGDCEVDLERVKRIQMGQSTTPFLHHEKEFGATVDRSMSLIYINNKGKETSLDLVMSNDHVVKYVHRCLKTAMDAIEYEKKHLSIEKRFLKAKWEAADSDNSGQLNKSEIIGIVNSMNIDRTKAKILEIFHSVDIDRSDQLDKNEYLKFMERLQRRRDLETIWGQIVSGRLYSSRDALLNLKPNKDVDTLPTCVHETITDVQFQEFWHRIQGEDITIEDAQAMIGKANGAEEGASSSPDQRQKLGYYEWRNLLNSSLNDIYSPELCMQYQDMSRTLSDYFIASSHNTYLEGDQLASKSSVNRYIDDLTSGCRCVELDCWDGDNGEPIVYHGHTLTGKIKFEDVVKAIKLHSFITSPYPVILSIENHCSAKQQVKMAEILQKVLKDSLAMPIQNAGVNLPSPQDLKYKVLIKGKRVKTHGIEHEEDDEPEEHDEKTPDSSKGKKSKKKDKKMDEEKETDTVPALSAITYLATGKVKSYTPVCSDAIPPDYMSSVSEAKTDKNLKSQEIIHGWVNHNRVHLTRIYPKGTRIDSSNYDPTPAWAAGNQMVALNYQTGDLHKHINLGKFRQNGSCGYVLKPPYMQYTPPSFSPPRPTRPIRLNVHVISGQQLPKANGKRKGQIVDPYVQVHIHGMHEDTKLHSTKVINNNGFNPLWDEMFQFTITEPDVAHLTLTVYDKTFDSFIGYSSVPLGCLRPGLRNVTLHDRTGQQTGDFQFASLLIRTEIDPL